MCALTTSGGVDCWGGDNTFGELGDGNDQPSNVPVPVSGISNAIALANAGAPGNPTAGDACALLATGTVECWGRHAGTNSDGTIASSYVPEPVTGMSSATALTAGGYYTCAAISSGSVSCKDIETNPATYTSFPIQATSVVASTTEAYYACAVLSSGGVDCWGQNYTGQLGDGTTTSSSSPVQASGVTGAKALAIGLAYTVASWGNHTCAVLTSGGVDCWGYNGYGELGNGTSGPGHDSSVPVSVSGLSGAVAVTATYSEFSTGGGTTCALLTDGAVDCWGANNYGQLGDGATGSSSSTPVRVTGLG